MREIIEGKWDDLVARQDLRGRKVRVIIPDEDRDNPWLRSLQAWFDSHEPQPLIVDDSRESIYSGTVDDPR